MLKHNNETEKKKSTEPHLEKTGSIWKDAQKMIQAMESDVGTPSPHGEEHESSHGLIGHVAHGLGMISKGAHVIQKHLPHSLHKIEEVAEVVAEAFQDDTSGNIVEDTVCGALSGVAKVGAATAGMLVLPEIEIPIMMETALGSLALEVGAGLGAGALVQHAFDAVTKPVGDAVKDVCHGSFDLVKDILADALEESKPNLELKPQESKISDLNSKAQSIVSRTSASASLSTTSYLGPEKSMYSPKELKAPYRGDDFTAAFNKEDGPWISPDYRREIEGALGEYFASHPSQTEGLFNRFIPAFGFKNAEEKATVFRQFQQDAGDALMKIYPESDLSGVDKKAFVKHYFSALIKPEQASFPQEDFMRELNLRLATDPKYSEVRTALHQALPLNQPVYDPTTPLKDCVAYANQSAEYAQAVSLLSMAGMVDQKTGAIANKIMSGASAVSMGAGQLAASGFSLGSASLVMGGVLVCMSVVSDLFGHDEVEEGPNPLMLALEVQAKQLFEIFSLCASIYKEMKQEFSLLHEKLDKYHLDHVQGFVSLMMSQEANHRVLKTYIHEHLQDISAQLRHLQTLLPEIREASDHLKQQSIEQHLEILDGLRRLDLAPDRRLVTRVRHRLAEHATTHRAITLEELENYTEALELAATAEAKEDLVTHAQLPLSFLNPYNAVWAKDIDVMDRVLSAALCDNSIG